MQIIVLGMHRSGTSAVTRIINMMGASTGPSHAISGWAADNEKGFWEREDVRAINDRLLGALDCTWDNIDGFSQQKLLEVKDPELTAAARRIILEMDTARPWVLKDPRMCLTLGFWMPWLEVPVFVFPHRFPAEIGQSLSARNEIPLLEGIALWEKYTVEVLNTTIGYPRIGVSYSELVNRPFETAGQLYEKLKEAEVRSLRRPSKKELVAFVEKRLYHQTAPREVAGESCNEVQRRLFDAMEDGSVLLRTEQLELSAGARAALGALSKRRAENGKQKTEYQSLVKDLEAIGAERRELNRQLQVVARDRAQLQQERDAVVEQNAVLGQKLVQAEKDVEGLRSELDAAIRDRTNLREGWNIAGEEIARQAQELAGVQAELESIRGQLESAHRYWATWDSERDSEAVARGTLLHRLDELSDETKELRENLDAIRGELETTAAIQRLSLETKHRDNSISRETVQALELQLREAEAARTAREQEIRRLTEDGKLLREWMEQIDASFLATIQSWRWRVGDGAVSLMEKLLGRRPGPLAAHHIQALLKQFRKRESAADKVPTTLSLWGGQLSVSSGDGPEGAQASSGGQGVARYDLICFANIDWDARYQRPQQLASQFARHGHRVFYVIASRGLAPDDPQGFRATQVIRNVFEVELMARTVVDRYSVVLDAENAEIFKRSLGLLRDAYGIVDAVCDAHLAFWTPLVLDLRKSWGWRILYDCMDEWEDFPNIGRPLLEAEKELVGKSDVVSVTAALLEEKWRETARCCVLVRNGVDTAFFAQRYRPSEVLKGASHPVIGFYGALAEWVDFGLVAAVAAARPDWHFVLIGDVFVRDLEGLEDLANVQILGRKPYEEMPLYLFHFDVCLIPFRLNNVTHAVDPVKFYEYLSGGKPVVSVPLKELEIYSDHLYFGTTAPEFVEQIDRALAENSVENQLDRIGLARANDWADRYEILAGAIKNVYPRVSIVVVTYKNVDLTRLCLESVLKNTTYPNFEIIVVDNASNDGTANLLRYLQDRFDDVRLVLNSENKGFASANNQGLELAKGEYLVLLNNDTVTPRGWLAPLLGHLKDSGIGLVGPVTNFVGNEAKIEVPYGDLAEMEQFATGYMREHQGKIFDIGVLAMFCVAMRRDVYDQVGALDERFGIGMFEDDDYSNRVRQKGYRVVCAEDAFVHHFGQAAFKKLIETGEYQRIWDENQSYYEEKWGKWSAHKHRRGRS